MDASVCDLEELWQGVRCRFRRRGGFLERIQWALYRSFHRIVRAILLAGIR